MKELILVEKIGFCICRQRQSQKYIAVRVFLIFLVIAWGVALWFFTGRKLSIEYVVMLCTITGIFLVGPIYWILNISPQRIKITGNEILWGQKAILFDSVEKVEPVRLKLFGKNYDGANFFLTNGSRFLLGVNSSDALEFFDLHVRRTRKSKVESKKPKGSDSID